MDSRRGKSRHCEARSDLECPLSKRTPNLSPFRANKQTSAARTRTSATRQFLTHAPQQNASSLDHFVSAQQDGGRQLYADFRGDL
jgi:hypothetical protein